MTVCILQAAQQLNWTGGLADSSFLLKFFYKHIGRSNISIFLLLFDVDEK